MLGLQCRGHVLAQNTLAVGIHDKRQETETITQAGSGVLNRNIGDVADPDMVGAYGYHVLHEVRIDGQVVA